jgi:hypothetical protein
MSLSTTTRRAVLGSLSAAALMVAATFPAHATDAMSDAGPSQATYINGGIGASDEQHMRQIAKEWPLRMTFSATKNNEFVADVSLRVTDEHGTPCLQLSDAGPMTYAKLPAGNYRVTASLQGRSETREVSLDGTGGRDLYFHWNRAA